jgi:hypothetical protein
LSSIFVLSGAGLFVVATRHFSRRRSFLRNSAVAAGIVVALRDERDGMDTQRFRFPRVRFQTSSGRDVTFEAGMGRSGDGWRVGDAVSVRYRLDQPEIAEFDSSIALWGPTALFGLLAVVFVGVGVSLWFGFIPG